MHDALGTGRVWHHRMAPRHHRFDYRLYFSLLDVEHIDEAFSASRLWSVESFNLVSFRRRDFLGTGDQPLASAVRNLVRDRSGHLPAGRVFLLAHLRQWGLCFNPVSFYFCHDADDRLSAIVAEIHNTPWNERHAYVLDCRGQSGPDYSFSFDKEFHVSPFMPMDMVYDWQFHVDPELIDVHMMLRRDGRKCFAAGTRLALQPMDRRSMRNMPLRFPLITARIIGGIYWQAARLWAKRIPFHSHPDKDPSRS